MQWRCRTADRIDPARRRNHNLHVASVKQLTHQRVDVMSALLSKTDLRELTMQVRLVPRSDIGGSRLTVTTACDDGDVGRREFVPVLGRFL